MRDKACIMKVKILSWRQYVAYHWTSNIEVTVIATTRRFRQELVGNLTARRSLNWDDSKAKGLLLPTLSTASTEHANLIRVAALSVFSTPATVAASGGPTATARRDPRMTLARPPTALGVVVISTTLLCAWSSGTNDARGRNTPSQSQASLIELIIIPPRSQETSHMIMTCRRSFNICLPVCCRLQAIQTTWA